MPSLSRAERPIKRRVLPYVSLPHAKSAHSRPGRHIAVTGRFFVGVVVMGYQLSQFAETAEGLTGQQRVVFAAMCKVTDDRHGFFWMDADRFRTEYLPHIRSNSTLRNHISALIDAGYIRKVHQGAGPRNGRGHRRRGRAAFTQYFIDAPGITPDLPRQYRMPLPVLMTPADELPSLFEDWDRSRSEEGQNSQDVILVREPDKSRSTTGQESYNTRLVRKPDKTRQDLSENRTSFVNGQDPRLVRKQDETRQDLSENQTSFGPYKEGNKKKKEKKHASQHVGGVDRNVHRSMRQTQWAYRIKAIALAGEAAKPQRPNPVCLYDSVSAYIEREGRAPAG